MVATTRRAGDFGESLHAGHAAADLFCRRVAAHFVQTIHRILPARQRLVDSVAGRAVGLAGRRVDSTITGVQQRLGGIGDIRCVVWMLLRLALRVATPLGRRLCLGQWRRWTHWEFWPPYVFYPPVVVYLLWLALKHRNLTIFTAANPAMPASGFVGESKSEILHGLRDANEFIARYKLIHPQNTLTKKLTQANQFIAEQQLTFPIIFKPDAGQRGAGVRVLRSSDKLQSALSEMTNAHILQEYVAGCEFGVFYFRFPGETHGRIFSITDKRFPAVTGDGKATLEQLVCHDERAVCMAATYGKRHRARWQEIIPANESITLAELGSHCRGAIFLDGMQYLTPALTEAIEHISQSYEGFYFGRYDIRAASIEAFQLGAFKVIELNGVTAEATHIYDPRYRVWQAYRVLFEQWRTAFAIGAANQMRGAQVYGWRELLMMAYQFYRGVVR